MEGGSRLFFPTLRGINFMPFTHVYGAKYKCIDKCPKKIHEYNVQEELFVDTFTRSCVFKPQYDHNRYNFSLMLSQVSKIDPSSQERSKNLLDSINGFWDSYQRYLKRDLWLYKEESLGIGPSKKENNHSEPCSYNGMVREIISPYKETSYVCYCTKGHLGEACEISAGLFISAQIYISKTLQEISHTRPAIDQLLFMVTILNKPKVDIKNLATMVSILYDSLEGKPLTIKLLNTALKVVDYIIENSVEM